MTASSVKENYRESRKRTKIKTLALLALIVCLGALALFVVTAKEEAEEDKRFTFEGNAQRVAFLNTYGLIVEPDPEREEVTVPVEFNAAFEKYNDLQLTQGFDLRPFAGREVTRYTYKVLNYPDLPENVVVNMLFDDHRLIGADITYNDSENGFTKALIPETIQTGAKG